MFKYNATTTCSVKTKAENHKNPIRLAQRIQSLFYASRYRRTERDKTRQICNS